jgi:hypothetical protein
VRHNSIFPKTVYENICKACHQKASLLNVTGYCSVINILSYLELTIQTFRVLKLICIAGCVGFPPSAISERLRSLSSYLLMQKTLREHVAMASLFRRWRPKNTGVPFCVRPPDRSRWRAVPPSKAAGVQLDGSALPAGTAYSPATGTALVYPAQIDYGLSMQSGTENYQQWSGY